MYEYAKSTSDADSKSANKQADYAKLYVIR